MKAYFLLNSNKDLNSISFKKSYRHLKMVYDFYMFPFLFHTKVQNFFL